MKGLDDERERERELLSQPRQDDPAIQAALSDVRGPRNVVADACRTCGYATTGFNICTKCHTPVNERRTRMSTKVDKTTKAEIEIDRLTDALDRIREHLNGGNVDAALNVIEDELGDEGETQ